ncbi:zinc finger CDGSH-type domain-containing protein [mine drainage metagenome]|uniref:Zinc finger CDGSH-type domain-containing protein n=1 Tax=mine drainage metagenome TaxID=410659 RepID=T0ZSB0_9ZZZZ
MRVIRHDRNHPFVVKLGGVAGFEHVAGDKEKAENFQLHMCACGLSGNKPLCDGSHMRVQGEEEGKIYVYDEEKGQVEVVDEGAVKVLESLPNEYE